MVEVGSYWKTHLKYTTIIVKVLTYKSSVIRCEIIDEIPLTIREVGINKNIFLKDFMPLTSLEVELL